MNPFLDSNLTIWINCRLAQSPLPYNERYPIILLTQYPLSHWMCAKCAVFYKRKLHFQAQTMCEIVKHASSTNSSHVLKLWHLYFRIGVICLFPSKLHIDFAAPIEIKASPLRMSPMTKDYVCVFVYFSAKAIHLELCSDLSSSRIFTDNGRNFLSACRSLERQFARFVYNAANDTAHKYTTHGFEWKFVAWAAYGNVPWKSFRFHLKLIIWVQKLNFEEFSTILLSSLLTLDQYLSY